MTEEEALKRLAEIAANGDREMAHSNGDTLISEFLEANGFGKLSKAYDDACQGWWYA